MFGGIRSASAPGNGTAYDMCRAMTAAALDEIDEKALWAQYGL
jgi:hypothetical protein